jgi:hypothetical protein
MQVCDDPWYSHEKHTETGPDDHSVVQWTTDVYVAIIDHYSQEKPVHVEK